MEATSLEEALIQFERDASGAVKTLTAALREVKKVQAAAAVGDLRALRNSTEASARLSDQAAESVRDLRGSWQFDESAYFESGEFTKEVLALGSAAP